MAKIGSTADASSIERWPIFSLALWLAFGVGNLRRIGNPPAGVSALFGDSSDSRPVSLIPRRVKA
jgi:hypothetical protein